MGLEPFWVAGREEGREEDQEPIKLLPELTVSLTCHKGILHGGLPVWHSVHVVCLFSVCTPLPPPPCLVLRQQEELSSWSPSATEGLCSLGQAT